MGTQLQFERNVAAALADEADLRARRPRLEARAALMAALRQWFREAGFLEVESPVRLPCPALEDYIDAVPSGGGH